MTASLRVAVIGAGRMGANHARVLAGIEGVVLAGVFDSATDRAQALADAHSCPVLNSLASVRRCADAAIVAVSSSAHAAVGGVLLRDGLPCLIEKPLAVDAEQCRTLIEASERAGVPLAVGHVERFNPAVAAAAALLADERILALEARRLNPGSSHIQDTDVVLDLMLHDIDTALYLLAAEPDGIAARSVSLAETGFADHATALLTFGPQLASLTASRIAEQRVRQLMIFCRGRTLFLDYIAQSLTVRRESGEECVSVVKAQSLERELDAFLAAVREQRSHAGVSAREALRTLSVVWSIQRALSRSIAKEATSHP